VLQCVAVCCSVLQAAQERIPTINLLNKFCKTKIFVFSKFRAVHDLSTVTRTRILVSCRVLQSVAVCCRVLQCVAVRCSVLQCEAVCRGSFLQEQKNSELYVTSHVEL